MELNLIKEFNILLRGLFHHAVFCQHDGEYRISMTDEKRIIMKKIDTFLESYTDFSNNVLLYGQHFFKLTEYLYAHVGNEKNYYVSYNYTCINKNELVNYCINNDLTYQNYILEKSNSIDIDSFSINSFGEFMEKIIDNQYCYEIPHRIESDRAINEFGHSEYYFGLNKFKFVNVYRLRDDVNAMKIIKSKIK